MTHAGSCPTRTRGVLLSVISDMVQSSETSDAKIGHPTKIFCVRKCVRFLCFASDFSTEGVWTTGARIFTEDVFWGVWEQVFRLVQVDLPQVELWKLKFPQFSPLTACSPLFLARRHPATRHESTTYDFHEPGENPKVRNANFYSLFLWTVPLWYVGRQKPWILASEVLPIVAILPSIGFFIEFWWWKFGFFFNKKKTWEVGAFRGNR